LPPSISPPPGEALDLLLLVGQILPQLAALALAYVLVKRFMAYRQLACYLLKAPLQLEERLSCCFKLGAMVLALRLDSERLSAISQACLGWYPRKKALWGTFKQLCNLRDG
jgi:hypothetical protein